ncbi:MAG: sugar phosphate isomerase/epimerase [Chitinophagaceae bacterium]
MTNRRSFIKNSGTFLLGAAAFSQQSVAALLATPVDHAIGLQLFTLFNSIDNDVAGSLKKIAGIGYKEIESAFSKKGGYYGMPPKEFAGMVKDMGMVWKSHHVLGAPFKLPAGAKMPTDADGKPLVLPPMKNLRDNGQEMVDQAAEGGVEFLVCASTPIGSLSEINASIATLNNTGEACKKAGIVFAYHNHDAEFRPVEGKIPYELILSQTSADTVKMELDLAWATKGGKDPVELFKQQPGRFPLWHVKDLDEKQESILPVGGGTINYKRIFENASIAGMKHFFVEHDMPADAFASITQSFNYIQKKLL